MPQTDSSQYDVLIGVVVGAQGLAGEVKVVPESDFPERFAQLQTVFVEQGDQGQLMTVTGSRWDASKRRVILKLQGVDDRAAAERLRGAQLCLNVAELVPLAEGQYYQFELLGLEVVTTTGQSLGPLREILRTGANDIYVTDRALIPAIDSVVKQIDLPRGRIVIEPIAGLLDSDR